MARHSFAFAFCVVCFISQVSSAVDEEEDVFETLSILEDEIYVLTRDMELLERKRKADRDTLMREMRLKVEQSARKEFSKVLFDMVRSGEISGLIRGDVLTETRGFREQLGQLKTTVVKTLKNRVPPSKENPPQPRSGPDLKKLDIQRMVRRVLGKRVKSVEKKVKGLQRNADNNNKAIVQLRSTLDGQNTEIREIKDGFTDQKKSLQDLHDLVKEQREMIEQLKRDFKNGAHVAANKQTSGVTEVEKTFVPITVRMPPTVSKSMTRIVEALEGGEVTLVCRYRGYNNPMVMWEYNDVRIAMGERIDSGNMRMAIRRPYLGEWNLRIRPVLRNDAGTYACKKLHPAPVETVTYNLVVNR